MPCAEILLRTNFNQVSKIDEKFLERQLKDYIFQLMVVVYPETG